MLMAGDYDFDCLLVLAAMELKVVVLDAFLSFLGPLPLFMPFELGVENDNHDSSYFSRIQPSSKAYPTHLPKLP
jgi:hypothetical protein